MNKETILVTGGAGYIGSITVKELLNAGYNVIVFDNLENGHKEAIPVEAKLFIGDLSDKDSIQNVFKSNNISAVIDFAAYLAVGESMEDPKKYIQNNVLNFLNLLDVMGENNCKYLIKSSTAAVYGDPENDSDLPLTEDYTEEKEFRSSQLLEGIWNGEKVKGEEFFKLILEYYQENISSRSDLKLSEKEILKLRIPASVYGLTKSLDEIIMKKYDDLFGLKSIALRYFNVAGADPSGLMGEDKPKPTNLVTVTFWTLLGKYPKLSVFGNDFPTKDGTGIRDYIHVCDLAAGHVKALDYLLKQKKSNTFNLGTGIGNSVLEIINAIEKASSKKVNYEVVGRRTGDPAVSYANASKANQILGWKTKYSIREMAETAWVWHKSHPNGYQKN